MRTFEDERTGHAGMALIHKLLEQIGQQAESTDVLPSVWKRFSSESIHLNNIASVDFHRGEHGGWHYAIRLKHVQAGCPEVLGSSSTRPHRTRVDAIRAAARVLSGFARGSDRPAGPQSAVERWFRLFDMQIALPEVLFEMARTEQLLRPVNRYTAMMRLEAALGELGLCGPLFSNSVEDRVKELSASERHQLLKALCQAHVTGLFRFPLQSSLSPSGHQPHLTPQ